MGLIKFDTDTKDLSLPFFIRREGENCSWRFIDFFTAQIRNKNTRTAYLHAVSRFFTWCERYNISLFNVRPIHVSKYIETHEESLPTIKQHLAAITKLFDYLVTGQIIPTNPARSVSGPRYSQKKGKTPILSSEDVRSLLLSIDDKTLIGARDKALIGIMIYSCARVSAVLSMSVGDFFPKGKRYWIRLLEKRNKYHEVPVHHKAEEYLEHYIKLAGIGDDKKGFLFRSSPSRSLILKETPMSRSDASYMIKRRAKKAGIKGVVSCHSFRATGITVYLSHGGTIENAQKIAAHDSPRTTKLYDHTDDDISLDEIERIII